MNQTIHSKPFIKWCGGKSRLIARIASKMPSHIRTYYEPFLGGGAVFFELAAQKRFDSAVLGDKCHELMNVFNVVRNEVEKLIEVLQQPTVYKYEKDTFLNMRAMDPNKMDPVSRAARTIYLNRTCYNGLYRVNTEGKFNTPFGSYKNPLICDAKNLRMCSKMMESTELVEGDFEDICTDAGPGDAIYFDPPYMPISKTSKFTQYTPGGFSYNDHVRLSNLFKELDGRGVIQVMSNSSNPNVLEMFNNFKIDTTIGPRSVGRPDKRESVPEVLIYNLSGE